MVNRVLSEIVVKYFLAKHYILTMNKISKFTNIIYRLSFLTLHAPLLQRSFHVKNTLEPYCYVKTSNLNQTVLLTKISKESKNFCLNSEIISKY